MLPYPHAFPPPYLSRCTQPSGRLSSACMQINVARYQSIFTRKYTMLGSLNGFIVILWLMHTAGQMSPRRRTPSSNPLTCPQLLKYAAAAAESASVHSAGTFLTMHQRRHVSIWPNAYTSDPRLDRSIDLTLASCTQPDRSLLLITKSTKKSSQRNRS